MRPVTPRTLSALALSLAVTATAGADATLLDFNNLATPVYPYASWFNEFTRTAGTDSYNVTAFNFGGAAFDVSPNVDATGSTTIELDLTINAAPDITGLGIVMLIVDEDGTRRHYGYSQGDFAGWFGLQTGESYLLTANLDTDFFQQSLEPSAPAPDNDFNLADISFVHLQIDTGGNPTQYNVDFNNLRLFNPTSLLIGDANGDSIVDLIDLSILASNFQGPNTPYTFADGDFNGDTLVDLIDLSLLAGNFGVSAAVPEPAAASLLTLSALLATRRRKA